MKAKFAWFLGLILLSYVGFSQCDGCPGSLTAPSSVDTADADPLFTSQFIYNGTAMECSTPADPDELNAILEGLDAAICILQDSITNITGDIVVINVDLTDLQDQIDSLGHLYDSLLVVYELVSEDGTISVTTNESDGTTQWDISVDIDVLLDSLMTDIDASCLDVGSDFDTVFQTLIDLVCELTAASTDTCQDWELYLLANITSNIESITAQAILKSVGSTPSLMCISAGTYDWYAYDADDIIISTGQVTGATVVDDTMTWSIPVSYFDGARTVEISGRWYKETCLTGVNCSYSDSSLTFAVSEPEIDELIARNSTEDTIQPDETVNILVTANDDVPYALTELNIVTNPVNGTVNSTTFSTGYVNFTAGVAGVDSFQYALVDVFQQSDSAWVIIPVVSCTDSSFSSRIDSICVTRTGASSWVFNPYYSAIPASSQILSWSLSMVYSETCDAVAANARAITTLGSGYTISSTTGGIASGNLSTQITQTYTGGTDACGGTREQLGSDWELEISWTDACGTERNETIAVSLPAATYASPQTDCY